MFLRNTAVQYLFIGGGVWRKEFGEKHYVTSKKNGQVKKTAGISG